MKAQQFFTLKEVQLNNNCPECYSNDGLVLTFKQKLIENLFYKAISQETKYEMRCNTCNTDIFPVRWTNGIEQVVEYQKRAVTPKPKSLKLKKAGWVFISVDILILVAILLFATGVISF
ncbi:hypothetical protein [Psychroserpens ponticola]|uniref:Uncharacterized protein n=1 Tax=Psychroserpens ponticola TaxID=2932268 RepID=A0ABY7RWF7_9FLAO|nr:hypothetical protein [Psychroserpens ponticola]WCO01417.1 hypothetical protein MUN68_015295 [Psychroserpens ponticola]